MQKALVENLLMCNLKLREPGDARQVRGLRHTSRPLRHGAWRGQARPDQGHGCPQIRDDDGLQEPGAAPSATRFAHSRRQALGNRLQCPEATGDLPEKTLANAGGLTASFGDYGGFVDRYVHHGCGRPDEADEKPADR